ncbi:hypothetical protein KEJ47_07440 [Candidatus Bathyarchaeota archaeon]|nr:hypothetical protein [Candidatus Bathyarchaeota archaeon]
MATPNSLGILMHKRWKKGFSNLLSTVILGSVLLAIMVVTSNMANDILTNQIASSEFDSAKDVMLAVESEIGNIRFKPGSTSVIKTSFYSSTAPGFTRTGENMNVTFSGKDPIQVKVNYFNIECRPGAGGIFDYNLKGGDSLLVPAFNSSLGRVRITKPYNWRVSLDYERVSYLYGGIIHLFNGTGEVPINRVEVAAIEIEFENFEVGERSLIILKNEGIITDSFILTGNWSLTVSSRGQESSPLYLTDIGGDPTYPTQLNFHKVLISIDVMESA